MLEGTGVTAADLRPDRCIAYAQVGAIHERAAASTDREDFGLCLGAPKTLATFGPVGAVMRHAAKLRDALHDLVRLQIANFTGAAAYLYRSSKDVALAYGVYRVEGRISPEIRDLVLAHGLQLNAELTQGKAGIEEIHLMRSAPRLLNPYRHLADVSIRFGESQSCIFLSADAMSLALRDADPKQKP